MTLEMEGLGATSVAWYTIAHLEEHHQEENMSHLLTGPLQPRQLYSGQMCAHIGYSCLLLSQTLVSNICIFLFDVLFK